MSDPHAEPTDEYSMRHAANGLLQMAVDTKSWPLTGTGLDAVNFAYRQLLRGANTLHTLQAALEAKP